jgi:hypothetical protein
MLLNRWLIVIISLIACTTIKMSYASETLLNNDNKIISIAYLLPTEESRDIKTISVNFNYLISRSEKLNLSIYFDIAGVYATGNISQLEGSLEAGTLKEVHYDNSAFGLGPGLLTEFQFFDRNKLSAHLNGIGNIIIYNKKFPAGGDHYNFMWRGGPAIEYRIGNSKYIGISYQWTHISNGHGLGPQNPSYDAQGFTLMFKGFF